MLYAQANELLTREALRAIPIPERDNVSARWQGINHGALADTILKHLEKKRFGVINEQWKTNKQGTRLFGAIDLKLPGGVSARRALGQDGVFSLGVRHSNDGRYALAFAVGARVSVCENGLLVGEHLVAKRHTRGLDIDLAISCALERYIDEARDLDTFVNALRERELSPQEAEHLLLETGRQGILPWEKLGAADALWRKPRYKEFQERTAWSLYNAVTETVHDRPFTRQMESLARLKELFFAPN